MRSACTRALTKVLTSGAVVRSPRAAKASARDLPIWISESTRANSPPIGPVTVLATWRMAASKPWPASTQTVSMSRASARPLRISVWRFSPRLYTRRSGRKKPRGCHRHGRQDAGEPEAEDHRPRTTAEHEPDALDAHDPLDGPGCRVARLVERARDAVARAAGRQPLGHPSQRLDERVEEAVARRELVLADGLARGLVVDELEGAGDAPALPGAHGRGEDGHRRRPRRAGEHPGTGARLTPRS